MSGVASAQSWHHGYRHEYRPHYVRYERPHYWGYRSYVVERPVYCAPTYVSSYCAPVYTRSYCAPTYYAPARYCPPPVYCAPSSYVSFGYHHRGTGFSISIGGF